MTFLDWGSVVAFCLNVWVLHESVKAERLGVAAISAALAVGNLAMLAGWAEAGPGGAFPGMYVGAQRVLQAGTMPWLGKWVWLP